jgi:hypothetical protein
MEEQQQQQQAVRQWRLEGLDRHFWVTMPDGVASFVVSRAALLRLGSGLIDAALGDYGDSWEGVIDCPGDFIFIPYCPQCSVKDVNSFKSAKSPISSYHQAGGQEPTPETKERPD